MYRFDKARVLLCFALAVLPASTAAQNLRELAREQAARNPGEPIEQPAPPADYPPKTIEDLAGEANLTLQARLKRIKSYLGPSEDRVLTDYSIVGAAVIAGSLPVNMSPSPRVTSPLILTVYGGEVVVEGVRVRATDYGRDAIQDGGEYLLFLQPSRRGEAGRYEIYHAGIFHVSEGRARPLLKQADGVFLGTAVAPVTELLSRIRAAVNRR